MTPTATEQPSLSISVKNFGPVAEGQIQLKPLTVLIGPNNTGKSYLALLIYALTKVLRGGRRGVDRPIPVDLHRRVRHELQRWAEQPDALLSEDGDVSWSDLPPGLRSVLGESVSVRFHSLRAAVETGLQDYFGVDDSSDLVRWDSRSPLDIHVANERPLLSLHRRRAAKNLVVDWQDPDLSALTLGPPAGLGGDFTPYSMTAAVWNSLIDSVGVPPDAHYLPAARLGIMNGWQVYASLAVDTLRRRVGVERIELLPLTGVAGDFIQVLLERLLAPRGGRRRPVPTGMRAVLEILEGEILQGVIEVDKKDSNQSTLLYRDGQFRLGLHRASSMIAELAPLDLWVKHLLRPGELLIIDEPEAHQHPENQRRIAKVLVRLVRAGVNVLCTTHSSLILHQLSNHLLASEAPALRRSELKFGNADLLRPDELGVYLFEPHGHNTQIREIAFEPGFGIPEDEFVRVSEAVGEETFELASQA